MRHLASIVRRNRSILTLFTAVVLLPAVLFAVLIVRAIRSERVRLDFDKVQRQQQVVRLAEADLTNWLFGVDSGAARAQALLRFDVEGDTIRFRDFDLSLPASDAARRRPFESPASVLAPTAASVTEQYYPRIQAFLRDLSAGRHAGAQYFLRLKAVVVRPPGRSDGYVVGVRSVVEHMERRLAELSAGERFAAAISVADTPPQAAAPGSAVAMQGFPFFWITFTDTAGTGLMELGRGFPYSIALLVTVAVLGSVFVYRVVSQEMRLAEMRSDFVAAVSHEFRSPLSSILALSERLESARVHDPHRLAAYHEIIARDARRLSALVTRLLDFGQMDNGRRHYRRERIDLTSAVAEAVETCRADLGSERIHFVPAATRPQWVRADRDAVRDAVQNLIDNAAKYSPPASPITVTCLEAAPAHMVEVQDRGMGIPPAEQQRIFDKFYRGREVVDLNVVGVGVGLALVRGVMEAHGGAVTVASEPGAGSRFRLSFPIDA